MERYLRIQHADKNGNATMVHCRPTDSQSPYQCVGVLVGHNRRLAESTRFTVTTAGLGTKQDIIFLE